MNNIIDADDSSVDKLKQIVSLHVHITSNNQYGMASLNNDWMHLNETLQHYLKLREDYEDNFREIIKEGINRKEFNNANPDILLFSILSTLRSLYIWVPNKKDLKPDVLSSELSAVLLNGLTR